MKNLLAQPGIAALERLSKGKALLGFDFDGTLAPIVRDRNRAKMRARTASLFAKVCERWPCVVLTGRHGLDVRSRLGRAKVSFVVGNHGLEVARGLGGFWREMRVVQTELRRALEGERGLDFEDKGYSLAIHLRGAPSEGRARAAIASAVTASGRSLRIISGKQVVNVVSAKAPHKGEALARLQRRVGAESVLYVGDDVTDEDVFGCDELEGLVSVRVGRSGSSRATYALADQREIDRLLALLVSLREKRTAHAEAV